MTIFLMIGTAALTARSPGSLSIPPHEGLAPCPIESYSLQEISNMGEPGCEPTGSSILLPNGTALEIDRIGVLQLTGAAGPGVVLSSR